MSKKVLFHSNLDLVQQDIWLLNQTEWNSPPHVGERIQFDFGKKAYELEVKAVKYILCMQEKRIRTVYVELHIPFNHHCESIIMWEQWYKYHILG